MSSNTGNKDPGNVARGLKATIHRANVSAEAKQNAAHRLEQMGEEVPNFSAGSENRSSGSQTRGRIGGHLNTSGLGSSVSKVGPDDEARADIEDSVDESYTKGITEGETNRVLGGYKATLKNPKVSEEAKEHAREVLDGAYD